MLSVTFVDHSEKIKELLSRKLLACVKAAAVTLADGYQTGLQDEIAPPHSGLGQIPHAYLGHKPGGFGPVNGYGQPNNTPQQGFARDQTEYLSDYIRGDANGDFGSADGYVGFAPSHVVNRQENYLLMHNASGRPWVLPLFRKNRQSMVNSAKNAFEGTE